MKKITKMIALLLAVLLLTACAPSAQQPTEQPTEPSTQPQLSDAEILEMRREQVVEAMRAQLTCLWRATEDITYSHAANSAGAENDPADELLYIKKGRVYRGIPYSHGKSTVEAFLTYATAQDSNGVYTISNLGVEDLNGNPTLTGYNRARIGSDCSNTLFWAWSEVSTTIRFPYTKRTTEDYGIIRVGTYTAPTDQYTNTKMDAAKNGVATMSAAYAQLQKGDGLVMYTSSGGHTMMVTEVNVVMNGNKIDASKSYVLIMDQTTTNVNSEACYYDEKLGENVYYWGNIDKKYTFQSLCSAGYLPFTCKELIDPSPLPEKTVTDTVSTYTKDNIFTGVLKGTYRISSVTVTIFDSTGKKVQELIGYSLTDEMYDFQLERLASIDEKNIVQGSIDLNALSAGTYRCTHVCQFAGGDEITVRDFTFTV